MTEWNYPLGECKKIDDVSDASDTVKYNLVKLKGNTDGRTQSRVSTSNEKSEAKGGKQQHFYPFFSTPAAQNEDDTQ